MTIGRIKELFEGKEYTNCPLTEKLVKAGYQQKSGGYIDCAKSEGLKVRYQENKPSQYWHLMSYCNSRDLKKCFPKSIVCGELILWMAEVSEAVSKQELEDLVNIIINSIEPTTELKRPTFDRKKWNQEIHNLCFEKIITL